MDMINVSSGRSKISLKFSYLSSCIVTETSGLMGWLGGCLLSLVIWITLRNYGWTGISLKELFLVVMVHRLLPTWMDCKYIVRINIFSLVSLFHPMLAQAKHSIFLQITFGFWASLASLRLIPFVLKFLLYYWDTGLSQMEILQVYAVHLS